MRLLPAAQIKPDDVWSIGVHGVRTFEGRWVTSHHDTIDCGAAVLHVFNMFRLRVVSSPAISNDTAAYLWALKG